MTAEEVINPGEDVIGSGGDKVGTVEYVVVDPNHMHITDIVVSTGSFLGRDVVVPVADVDRVGDGKVWLTADQSRLKSYKDYVDVEYQSPPSNWIPAAGMAYPTGTMLWPAGVYYPELSSVTVNTPEGTVGLHAGMDVMSSDGHKIGSIDALVTDPSTEDITEIVVKHGFIFTHDTSIPASHVKSIESDRVNLDLTRDAVKRQFEGQSG